MKKLILALAVVSVAVMQNPAEANTENQFKNYMHEIFKNFRNTDISVHMNDLDLADIHLKHLEENIDAVHPLIPDLSVKGKKMESEQFLQRLKSLRDHAEDLRGAIKKKESAKVQGLPHDMLNICVGCHTNAKLRWLFRLPTSANYFEDYSHEAFENVHLAGLLMGSKSAHDAEDHLKISRQYLYLIENIPATALQGSAVADRKGFVDGVNKAERFIDLALEDLKEGKLPNLNSLKTQMKKICASCHDKDAYIP